MDKYSVVIVEDDLATLARIRDIIDGHAQLTVIATCTTINEGKQLIAKQTPTVLLTDLGLPDGNGSELIRFVYQQYPNVLTMVLSLFGDEQNVVNAIMAGAKGYLLKKGDPQPIPEAILQLIDGASPISAAIARYLLVKLHDQTSRDAGVPKLLTEREAEVLELVSQGYRSREIADKLGISYHTVVHHIRIVYDKLAVSTRGQAIHKATKIGLIKNIQ